MTNQNIFDYVRGRTATNTQTATNTTLFIFLNERHRQLWLALQDVNEDYGGEISTTDLVANQQEYPEPDECMKIKRVEIMMDGVNWRVAKPFDANENLDPNDSTHIAQDFATDYPYFDVHDESLFLFPIPTQNVTNGIKMWFIRRPQDMSLTTVSPGLPKEHHIWLVDLIVLDVEQARGRLSAVEAEAQAARLLDQFKKMASPRVQGQKVRVKPARKNYK